jgi:hypothetical protein
MNDDRIVDRKCVFLSREFCTNGCFEVLDTAR